MYREREKTDFNSLDIKACVYVAVVYWMMLNIDTSVRLVTSVSQDYSLPRRVIDGSVFQQIIVGALR